MDILTALLQLANFGGSCGTAATETATTCSNALGGLSGLTDFFTMICKLFGLGC